MCLIVSFILQNCIFSLSVTVDSSEPHGVFFVQGARRLVPFPTSRGHYSSTD